VQTDGTAPQCTITSSYLRVFGRYLDDAEKVGMNSTINKEGAFNYRILDARQQIATPFNAGMVSYDVNLNSFSGLTSHVAFVVRNSSNVNTSLANNFDSFNTIASFSIKNANNVLTKYEHESNFNLGIYNSEYFPGDITGQSIYTYSFNNNPHRSLAIGTQEGSQHLSAIGEQLRINFNAAPASAFVVDVIGWLYQMLELKPNGFITKRE